MDSDIKKYINLIHKIKEYDDSLDHQNLWWTVVAMVGKINNQGLEPQLLDSISATQAQFDKLKSELISSLVSRYLEKVEVDLRLKGQAFIDILNRNLFERTADVGFLATDQAVVSYLKEGQFNDDKRVDIEQRLNEYVHKYTVYMDIALFSPNGEIVASLTSPNLTSRSASAPIFEAQKINDYIEYDHPIEGVEFDQSPLYFLHRVTSGSDVVGVLCMSFKFIDELERIEKTLNVNNHGHSQGFELALSSQHNVLYKTDAQFSFSEDLKSIELNEFSEKKINSQDAFCYCTPATGYQGYQGLDWISSSYIPLQKAFLMERDSLLEKNLVQESALFPFDLYMLNLEINTALTIVVLNGKISSLKNKVESFLPVLDYFQDIGTEVKEVFASSINHIHAVSHATMQEKATFAAQISQEVMDRNLYERANDVRWWALNPLIMNIMSQESRGNFEQINETLKIINNLYTVYTVLFVFDENGKVVAVSNKSYEHYIGTKLADNLIINRINALQSSQQYAVSEFEVSKFYDNRPTYTYYGAIRDKSGEKALGGIAAVFDAEPEFHAILQDFLPKDSGGQVIDGAFSFVMDSRSNIISATENGFGLKAGLKLDELAFETQQITKVKHSEVTLYGESYIVSSGPSLGYREYKNSDGYVNDMACYVCVKS